MHRNQFSNALKLALVYFMHCYPSLLTVHWSFGHVTLSVYCTVILHVWKPYCSTQIRLHVEIVRLLDNEPTAHLASIWGHSNLLGRVLLSVQGSLEKTLPNYKPQSHCPPGRMLPFYSWSTNTSSPWQLPPWLPHPHTHPPSCTHTHTVGKGTVAVNFRWFYVLRLSEIVVSISYSILTVNCYNAL